MLTYNCTQGITKIFNGSSIEEYNAACCEAESNGYVLFDENIIKQNYHRTYIKDDICHIYFCESEKTLRVINDSNKTEYLTRMPVISKTHKTTLWQFEVDHSLIDCGMCYIVRCCDGSFFVIDSAHMYSVNDDKRLIEFLTRLSNGKKPVIAGWFFSHAHEDHIDKFLDVIRYLKNEVDIKSIYYNFPPSNHKDSNAWSFATQRRIEMFEQEIINNKDIPAVRLHTGQKFFVKNLKFTVLCTHEDIYPSVMDDFNNSSTVIKMDAEGTSVLFPGDASALSDKILTERYGDYLKCDIIQVAHHGHSGCSPRFYELCDAECALFPVTSIKYDEEFPRQTANQKAVEISKEHYISSNGTVEIDLPYAYGNTVVYPDETKEDWDGVYRLWGYQYDDETKKKSFWNENRIFSDWN